MIPAHVLGFSKGRFLVNASRHPGGSETSVDGSGTGRSSAGNGGRPSGCCRLSDDAHPLALGEKPGEISRTAGVLQPPPFRGRHFAPAKRFPPTRRVRWPQSVGCSPSGTAVRYRGSRRTESIRTHLGPSRGSPARRPVRVPRGHPEDPAPPAARVRGRHRCPGGGLDPAKRFGNAREDGIRELVIPRRYERRNGETGLEPDDGGLPRRAGRGLLAQTHVPTRRPCACHHRPGRGQGTSAALPPPLLRTWQAPDVQLQPISPRNASSSGRFARAPHQMLDRDFPFVLRGVQSLSVRRPHRQQRRLARACVRRIAILRLGKVHEQETFVGNPRPDDRE